MARRLVVTPEGVGELRDVSIDRPYRVGANQAIVRNDTPETVAHGEYETRE